MYGYTNHQQRVVQGSIPYIQASGTGSGNAAAQTKSIAMKQTTIHEFVELWKDGGYGIALVRVSDDKILTPYVDPNDYPDLVFTSENNFAKSLDGQYQLVFHSGALEELTHLSDFLR